MTPEQRQKLDQKLSAGRRDLEQFLSTLSDHEWDKLVYREPEEWTIRDTVRHLIQAEKSMVRLMDGIRQGHPGTSPDFDLAAFNRQGINKIADQTVEQLRENLTLARQRTIAFMDSLEEQDWLCEGRHAIGRVMSVAEICHLIADHEKGHFDDMVQ